MAKKEKKQKETTFDVLRFVDSVMEEMKLNDVNAAMRFEIREAIIDSLADRIIATVTSSMSNEDLAVLRKMMDDNPDMDLIEGVYAIVPHIKGLDEKLKRSIDALYDELVYDAKRIEEAMNDAKNDNNQ